MASPVFQLNPVKRPESLVDRYGKIAGIADQVEGRNLQRQGLELQNQRLQNEVSKEQRAQQQWQQVGEIIKANGGDLDKSLAQILQGGFDEDIVKISLDAAEKRAAQKLNADKFREDQIVNAANERDKRETRGLNERKFGLEGQQFGLDREEFEEKKKTTLWDQLHGKSTASVNNDTVATEEGVMQWNPDTKRYDIRVGSRPKPASTAGAGLSDTAESNVINRLSNQWQKVSQDVRDLYRANNIMDAGMSAARAGDRNAGAQAVLITFQKFLDPESVVRESEYARSAEGLSVANRVRGAIDRLQYGGAGVPVAELEGFAKLAKEINNRLAKESTSLLEKEKQRLGRTADRYKIPRDLIFADFNYSQPTGSQPAAPAAPAASGSIREQFSASTGQYRHSTDGGKTWKPGRAPK